MARLSKEEIARFEGMNYALELVEKHGYEAARKELTECGLMGRPLGVKKTDADAFVNTAKESILKTVTLLSAVTLRDEFDFGTVRLNRFIERFNEKTECLLCNVVSWSEMAETMKEETGIDFPLPDGVK